MWTFFFKVNSIINCEKRFSLFPQYFRDLELDVLEDIFFLCGSRKEKQSAAKDTTEEEYEAKAIVAEKETSEEHITTKCAKKAD